MSEEVRFKGTLKHLKPTFCLKPFFGGISTLNPNNLFLTNTFSGLFINPRVSQFRLQGFGLRASRVVRVGVFYIVF